MDWKRCCCRAVRRAAGSRSRARGTTLGELAAVTAIVGIGLAVTFPVVGNLHAQATVKTMASELAASLRLARTRAIETRTPVSVEPNDRQGWAGGWRIKSRSQVLEDHAASTGAVLVRSTDSVFTYASTGRLLRPGERTILFHAPTFRWVQGRCVHIAPDGRVIVRASEDAGAACVSR